MKRPVHAHQSILLALALAGCAETSSPVANGPSVMVSYESQPLADVQVSLHATETGPVLAQAVSAADGHARFQNLPVPEPSEYRVSLQSLSDGGWILNSKYSRPGDSDLRLKPLAGPDPQTIEISRGAVRPLLPTKRR